MTVSKVILLYFKEHKFKAFLILFMILLVTVLSLAPAQILRIIVDDAIGNSKIRILIIFSIVYALMYLLIGIITFIKDVIMLSTSQDITAKLRCNMMSHVHKIDYNSLVNTDSGTLEAYFNNDVNSINELFTSGIVNICTDFFKMLGIVVTIFIYSWLFGAIVLAIMPILILFTSFVRKRMMKAQLKTKSLEGNVNKVLLENVENIEQIKVNKAENYSKDKYSLILQNHFKTAQASNLYDAIFSPVMQIVRNIVVVSILLISGFNHNIFGMSIGMIISSISLITDLFTPIEALGMEIQTIQKSLASVKRINQFFKIPKDDKKNINEVRGINISFDNVSFGYNDKLVIKNFNLVVNNGEKVAFQGPSGAGKSTLMKLAMGLIKPTSGEVLIGDVPSYDLSDEARSNLFSIVYQEPFFSDGSILDEVRLNDKRINKDTVREALDKVGLQYITNLDEPLISSNYSSGELALFNIARIIARDTKVVFLDEMNSKIDPVTAKKIISLINENTKDKIVISINHYGDILEGAKVININRI
ncbi:MAG: ABC transporter ATP-binding protein [Anaeroplasmataceae bacterium]